MTYIEQANLNEVWMDADGCLYLAMPEYGGWFAFGSPKIIFEDNPLCVAPMIKVFEADGTRVYDGNLTYPDGDTNG